MFNPILDTLPTEYGGYRLNTDFRQPLKFFRLLQDSDLSEREKDITFILMFFPDWNISKLADVPKLADFIGYYIRKGEEPNEDSDEQVFDWEIDSGRLLSAFWQVYKIDLSTAKIHWWTFLELFNGLPENTSLQSVINIRAMEIPKRTKENSKYVSWVQKAKERYKLKKTSVEDNLADAWERW